MYSDNCCGVVDACLVCCGVVDVCLQRYIQSINIVILVPHLGTMRYNTTAVRMDVDQATWLYFSNPYEMYM